MVRQEQSSGVINWCTYWPLCQKIQQNDWKAVEDFVQHHPETLTVKISSTRTIFHHIINYIHDDAEGAACLIENLASKIDPETLEQKGLMGLTILDLCAIIGNTRASEIFVKYNPDLPNIRDVNGWLAIHTAAYYGHKATVQYLIQVTAVENLNGRSGALLISYLIKSNLYDIALDFLKQHPPTGLDHISSRNIVLGALAEKPLSFASGIQLGRLERLIYNCIPVKKDSIDQTDKNQSVAGDAENPIVRSKCYSTKSTSFRSLQQITNTFGAIFRELNMMLWNALVLLVPCIKVIHDQKLTHIQAVEIVRMICEGVVWNDPQVLDTKTWLHTAAELGISEIVAEIIMAYHESVYWVNQDRRSIFQLAVLHRREKVFRLIHGYHFLYDMLAHQDKFGNNLLHLAGRLVPSSEIAGAALQMQRELQWFKAVGNLVRPSLHEQKNNDHKTPREVFTEEHKYLVKEGEKWMKETASSCTIAVTLIVTVVFAAAFTVPCGNNNEGVPNFLHKLAFIIFAISDALALFSSTTSLLMFLGILTSRYAEEDFLVSLPKKLIIGLITLFLSVASMMVAFGATIYLVLSQPWKWVIIPISLLGCVPVTLFVLLQFPLLVDMYLSTYGPSIFRPMKKNDCSLLKKWK